MNYAISHHLLHFKQPAGTSRGVYQTRDVWYVTLSEGNRTGTGECAPLPDLSCDALPHEQYEELLRRFCVETCLKGSIPFDELRDFPSILFGLECAFRKLRNVPYDHQAKITINGLVWMGSYEEMRSRLEEKLQAGFRCIKLKIGAINFEDEIRLIQRIRKEFPREMVELRVDANGAFSPKEAPERLERLANFDLHSIEQPIKQGQWKEMAHLCSQKILPIALDEELIGINEPNRKAELLETIRPQYIILKPSLHGGLKGCDEWIRLAEENDIGWWATSALESNIGLADIARWLSAYHPTIPQGLGTGQLFTDNTPAETELKSDVLNMLPDV